MEEEDGSYNGYLEKKELFRAKAFRSMSSRTGKALKNADTPATCGKSSLYVRIKRDAACIFALSHKKSILELQYLLSQLQLPLLGEA